MNDVKPHPASFRDPAGFIFEQQGIFYRQVNQCYAKQYQHLNTSGLYHTLVKEKKLLPHTEIEKNFTQSPLFYKTLLPQQLGFVSYGYEWCFSQWKDAALLTLSVLQKSIEHGMILKDATPFNIQFIDNKPIFIDTLSFEKYDATKPWVAYQQFIQCFIAPLVLAKYQSPDLLTMFQLYPQGIPLRIVAKLLPWKSGFNANVFLHIRLPNKMIGNSKSQKANAPFTATKLNRIISNLQSFVSSIHLPVVATAWNNYYQQTVLSNEYVQQKMIIIKQWLKEIPANTVLDIGTNTGLFAQAAAAAGKATIAIDADTACIDNLYNTCKQNKIHNLYPLCIDVVNPSTGIGWANAERLPFFQRCKTDITMALALIHHLAIAKNISFQQMAQLFSSLSPYLIIEFVPKTDAKVKILLQNREDVFSFYSEEYFLTAFQQYFNILNKVSIAGTQRTIFLMKIKTAVE